ncbi:MAG TPA: helix-hairpin-helix domain-containing protein [Candidatus Saccharimonadales bacterium]|nr:helix-hairpin-helix domain-containing protein [Candidatus Saccharimonadales bacterium]
MTSRPGAPPRGPRAGTWLAAALLAACAAAGAWAPAAAQSGTQPETAAPAAADTAARLDINRAPLAEIRKLPIPAALADAIYDYREYRDFFRSVYDLMNVPGMTPEILAAIRDRVTVEPRFMVLEDPREDERLESIADLVQRLLSQEGASEGLVDEYIDLLKQPRNVNNMDYFALTGIQNVSPVDATAILKARQEKPFETTQELRRTDGLSYWGYRNLRDYVRFDEEPGGKWQPHVDYQFRVYNTPYETSETDILTDQLGQSSSSTSAGPVIRNESQLTDFDLNSFYGRMGIGESRPYVTNKLRVRLGQEIKAGFLTHRNMGEKYWDETDKWYVGVDGQQLGPIKIHHAYIGNYRLALGQGLLMDNTDFFMARRTGMGFNVRPVGVRGDISRSDESSLRGAAVEASVGPVRSTLFYSSMDKDAILNPDSSFNRYITMFPRVDNDMLAQVRGFVRGAPYADSASFLPMADVMHENIVGANFRLEPWIGTYLGVTGMEMRYSNNISSRAGRDRFNPLASTLVSDPATRIEPRDAEITGAYNNTQLGPFRDFVGMEAGTVVQNVALSGEYSKLMTAPKNSFLSRAFAKGPEAWLGSAYVQYENLTLQALYRNIDIGYDNPYDRAFSETNRYDQTILSSQYYLNNPLYAMLSIDDPQSQPERGLYLSARYQINRNLTLSTLEYDTYERNSDGTKGQRMTAILEYRPIFPFRIRLRQRYSDRDGKGTDEVRGYKSWDTRVEARVFLSRQDLLEFLYSTTNVKFVVRPRLYGTEQGATALGSEAVPAQAFQAMFTHHWNPAFSTEFSSEVYDGFLWNYEDNEFLTVDGTGFRNWVALISRLSSNLSWRLKYTVDFQQPVTWIEVRQYPDSPTTPPSPGPTNARRVQNSFRFQLDYSF